MSAPREHDIEDVDPRDVEHEQVGSPLRDAAVDPQAGDFLPPTNAGEANPHGPLVVSPGVHASETGPIAPGPVSKDPEVQQAKETSLAEAVFVQNQPVPEATKAADDTPQQAEVAPEDSRPAEVEGEPEGASARASDGTSDTTEATRTVAKKSTAKAKPAESAPAAGDDPAATK